MPYVLNKDNAEESYDVIPEGIYQVKIEKAEEKLSSNNNEMMSFMCDIIGPTQKGRKLFFCIVYTTTFVDSMFAKLCASCGIDWKTVGDMTPELFTGKFCHLSAPGTEDGFPKIKVVRDKTPTPIEEPPAQTNDMPF